MKVTWEVDDGYVGHGKHETIIEDSYLEELSEEDKMMEIEEWVGEDFASNISYRITHINGKKV